MRQGSEKDTLYCLPCEGIPVFSKPTVVSRSLHCSPCLQGFQGGRKQIYSFSSCFLLSSLQSLHSQKRTGRRRCCPLRRSSPGCRCSFLCWPAASCSGRKWRNEWEHFLNSWIFICIHLSISHQVTQIELPSLYTLVSSSIMHFYAVMIKTGKCHQQASTVPVYFPPVKVASHDYRWSSRSCVWWWCCAR